MINFITSIFYPEHHPIERLNSKHREEYVRGLGELLSFFMPNNMKAKFAFNVLCKKLSDLPAEDIWSNEFKLIFPTSSVSVDKAMYLNNLDHGVCLNQVDVKTVCLKAFKRAISLKREGLIFFRMSKSFWCDFYRICKIASYPIDSNFNSHILNQIISKSTSKYSYDAKSFFYANGNGEYMPSELKRVVQDEKLFKDNGFIRILVVGTMSSGKSTLINALVGHKITKTKTTVCTSTISYICNRPIKDFVIYSDGNTCIASDHIDNSLVDYPIIGLSFEGRLNKKPIILIDTPGVNYAYDIRHRELTEKEIKTESYDAIICVVNSCYMESEDSKLLVDMVAKVKGKKKIFVLNQFDRFDSDDDSIEESINHFKSVMHEVKTKGSVIPFSAKAAFLFKKFSMGDDMTNIEKTEMLEYKKKMDTAFYDLGAYVTGKPSKVNCYKARTGLTYLENIILNK